MYIIHCSVPGCPSRYLSRLESAVSSFHPPRGLAGIACLLVGVTMGFMDIRYPEYLADFFGVDPLQDYEEHYYSRQTAPPPTADRGGFMCQAEAEQYWNATGSRMQRLFHLEKYLFIGKVQCFLHSLYCITCICVHMSKYYRNFSGSW